MENTGVTCSRLWLFLKLTRPLFLMGGIILFVLGAAAAWHEGAPVRPAPLFTGQLLVTCIQLMTHYANEYFDQECDRINLARTWFSGGSGVLADGSLPPGSAMTAALVCAGLAVIFLALTGLQAPILIPFGIAALLAGWFYSAPPLALSGSGWGEASATLVVAGMVPFFGYATQISGGPSPISGFIIPDGTLLPPVLWVCLSLGLIHMAMLIAFQIPDYSADRQVGKRTLAVRLGTQQAVRIHNLALLTAFGILLTLSAARLPGANYVWLALPLALWQAAAIRGYLHPATQRFTGLTTRALVLFALTAVLWLAGFVI